MMTRRLDILLATHGPDGLERVAVMAPPQVEGVHWIVVWQVGDDVDAPSPQGLQRPDVEIIRSNTTGCSRNHNIALAHAKADLCLVADNDLHYYPERLAEVIAAFDARPDVDLITFRYDGDDCKWYPPEECDLTRRLPKGYCVTMFEVAFRRKAVEGRVRFNENFGVGGMLFNSAIDDMFLLESRLAGLRCRFVPLTIVRHDGGLTTGYRPITNPRVAAGQGAFIRQAYGLLGGYPRLWLFALRGRRNGRLRFLWGLRHLHRGFFTRLRPY